MKAMTPFLTSQVVLVGAALMNLAVSTSAAISEEPKLQQLPLIPHHHARRRLLEEGTRRDSKSDVEVASLYQGYGTHYVDVWVGTPAQRQTLIVDTGSGITAFPCRQCDEGTCGQGAHIDDFFDETLSTSYQKIPCNQCQVGTCGGGECKVGMSYSEGSSWNAFEAIDVVYMGGPHDQALTSDNGGSSDLDPKHAYGFSFPLVFGCQTKLTGLFKTQLADGIMGMYDEKGAFWNQMRAFNAISENKFSLCFTRQPVADKKGTESGALTMGGTDDRLHDTPMVYATRTDGGGKGFYNVHVRKIYLRHASGGDSSQSADNSAQIIDLNVREEKLNAGKVIVDSGSTDTNFSPAISRQLKQAFQQLSGHAYSHTAVRLTESELLALPTILIQLAGDDETNMGLYPTTPNQVRGLAGADMDPAHPYDVLLAVPPSHYMEYNPVKKTYVNRFYTDSPSGSVIGANAMMGHDVFFDLDNNRIGWAESTCDYHELVSNGGFVDANKEKSTPGMPAAPSASQERIFLSHPAIDKCSDLTCRGTVVACLLGFFIIGIAIGNACRRAAAEKAKVGYKRVIRCPDALEEDLMDTEAPEGADAEFAQLVPVETH